MATFIIYIQNDSTQTSGSTSLFGPDKRLPRFCFLIDSKKVFRLFNRTLPWKHLSETGMKDKNV